MADLAPDHPPLAMAPKWPDLAYWREVAMWHGAEAQRLRTELAFARQVIDELTATARGTPFGGRSEPKAGNSIPCPFPARALQAWR
jgi:hypothetical protein